MCAYNHCRQPNVLFEYRIISKDFGNVVRNWSLQLPPIDFLEWLDGGTYTFQVRAIDTAGNKDMVYDEGRNQHTWEYVPALPWVLIILSIILFIIGMIILYLWYKRYVLLRWCGEEKDYNTLPQTPA